MKRDFLEGLGLEKETVDKIMAENGSDLEREKAKTTAAKADLADVQGKLSAVQTELEGMKKSNGDIAAVQKQLEDLQAKYDADIADRDAKLADRDYSDAITRAISGKGLKFSSKSAERAFIASLKEQKLELKDGELSGMDDFIKSQKEADPDAFAPDKPVPRIVAPTGTGGTPGDPVPANVAYARALGASRASALKASSDAMKNFM